jgi:hypothetical protein
MKNFTLILLLLCVLHTNSLVFKNVENNEIQKENENFTQSVERELAGEDKGSEYLKSIHDIIMDNKKETDLVDFFTDFSTQFKIKSPSKKGCEVEGFKGGQKNQITVTFKTPIDESTLTLNNIDPNTDKEKAEIIQKYIKPFISHVSQIVNEKAKVEVSIVEYIKNYKAGDGITLNASQEGGKSITVEVTKGEEKDIFLIDVTDQMDIKIKNIYFDSNFQLTIPTGRFLEDILKEMMDHVILNFERLKEFTSNDSGDGETQAVIDCVAAENIITNNLKYKDDLSFNFTNPKITLNGNNNVTFDYSCKTTEGSISYSILKFEGDGIIKELPFIKSSLYDLTQAIASFFDEVKDVMYKSMIDKAKDTHHTYDDIVRQE